MTDDTDAVTALNVQTMTMLESEIYSVDASSYLAPSETIIGTVSSFISPTTGAPTITALTYSNDGKSVSFRLNASVDGVKPGTYTISLGVTTRKDGVNSTRDLRVRLKVVR